MSKKIFVDSDVILDILCQREPHYEYAAYVFSLSDTKKIVLYTTSLVFSNVYYILRKLLGIQKAKEALRKLRLLVKVMPVEEKEVDLALNSKFSDFEDALQYYTAMRHGIKILLTRNIKDYKEKVDTYNLAKKSLANNIKKLEKELSKEVKPNLEEIKERVQLQEEKVSDFGKQLAVQKNTYNTNKELYSELYDEFKVWESNKRNYYIK